MTRQPPLARRLRRVLLRMSHRGLAEAFDALRRFARAELARLRVMRRVVQRATRLALALGDVGHCAMSGAMQSCSYAERTEACKS